MSAPLAPRAELAPGYRVVDHLSRNEALDVYDLFSEERACRCIGKVVRPDRDDDRAPERLVQEGEILLGLTHPHVVRAYELARVAGRPVLILETLTGATLGALFEEVGPLNVHDLAELGRQLCSAVGYLHRRGWLHLDLKPENVVAQGGVAKVLDLSLARRPGPVGAGLGTRRYSSPEQTRGGVAGPAADVWGLGAVLFEAATGRPPFAGHAEHERYPQLLRRAPRIGVLGGAVDACLEPAPADRPTVGELAAALEGEGGALRAAA